MQKFELCKPIVSNKETSVLQTFNDLPPFTGLTSYESSFRFVECVDSGLNIKQVVCNKK